MPGADSAQARPLVEGVASLLAWGCGAMWGAGVGGGSCPSGSVYAESILLGCSSLRGRGAEGRLARGVDGSTALLSPHGLAGPAGSRSGWSSWLLRMHWMCLNTSLPVGSPGRNTGSPT